MGLKNVAAIENCIHKSICGVALYYRYVLLSYFSSIVDMYFQYFCVYLYLFLKYYLKSQENLITLW